MMKSCGGCGQFHPKGFDGDCRDDANRPTVVVFRRWPTNESVGRYQGMGDRISGGIIALFPELPTMDGFIDSFEHVGQHGMADYSGVVRRTTPATPEEYANLKTELESQPYNYVLQVKKRRGR